MGNNSEKSSDYSLTKIMRMVQGWKIGQRKFPKTRQGDMWLGPVQAIMGREVEEARRAPVSEEMVKACCSQLSNFQRFPAPQPAI